MADEELKRIVLETTATRDRAEALLEGLLRAKEETERERERLNRRDQIKELTGASSIETAISSTKHMIETLNMTIRETKNQLTQVTTVGAALHVAKSR
jgi:hypothetical protein